MGMFLRRGPAPHRIRMSDLEIGQTIKLNVNGTPWDWLVVHQGLPSSIYDESCNGTWLLMKDIYERRQWNNSKSNGYRGSTINKYLNENLLLLFDLGIQEVIQQVKIPLENETGANGLPCKIFLLSGYEVGFSRSDGYFPADGAKLSYFEPGTGSSAKDKRIAKLNGSASDWWLRSRYTESIKDVWYVFNSGLASSDYATTSYGVRPALILPSDFIVSKEMLAA